MTVLQWAMGFKGCGLKTQKPANNKAKDLAGCERLGQRIGSIMLENHSNELLLRQQAGLDNRKKGQARRRVAAPKVYKFQQKYERNRKQKERQISEEQQRLRQFHSHPVPNFNQLHKRWEHRNRVRQMVSQHKVTTAQTPLTLVTSAEARKKREQKMQRTLQKQQSVHQRPKLTSASLDSWRKPPFRPRIQPSFIKVQPFHLLSEERGKRRKAYDERSRYDQQLRYRKQADEWAKRWREEYLILRNQTNFKARPNPCQSGHKLRRAVKS
ncbi:trichohyalin [Drosophila albomicans]|uniref:Trichohyalin n=1 Tax=Drosophila albomicans TaxID=7291 RepID=A0A9C6WCH3_DROAB|nr:trichohyalin [Drosophila albomicans]